MGQAAAVVMAAWVATWAGAAVACSPEALPPSSEAVRGEKCSVSWRPDWLRGVWLSEVKDLGNGYILQTAGDGNACYSESYGVLMDCAAGQALVFGPDMFDLMRSLENPGPSAVEKVSGRIEAAAKRGRPLTLDEAEAASADAGLTRRLRLKSTSSINLNGQNVPLGCGCRTYYPGLKPGN